MLEFYFKIVKSKGAKELINYLKTLEMVKPVKVINNELYKMLPIKFRNNKINPESLFGLWKNEKKNLKEIRKNWSRD